MLSALKSWFGFALAVEPVSSVSAVQPGLPRPAAHGPQPRYNPNLIAELKHDHRLLEASFAALVQTHRQGRYDACMMRLAMFTKILRGHLIKENVHLYIYLKHGLVDDAEAVAVMASMRAEMQAIGSALNIFVTEYTGTPWDEPARQRLGDELDKIGKMLELRIAAEEKTLYPLYVPRD